MSEKSKANIYLPKTNRIHFTHTHTQRGDRERGIDKKPIHLYVQTFLKLKKKFILQFYSQNIYSAQITV